MRSLLALWITLAGMLVSAPAVAAPLPAVFVVTRAHAKDLPKSDKAEKAEKDVTAAEKEAERKRKDKMARVIVLKWPDNRSVDFQDSTIQRTVRSRIARPDAQFFPEVDLYQNGRKVKDRTVTPANQPADVPETNLGKIREAVTAVERVPWNGMAPDMWGLKAQELRDLVELVWFTDDVEQREPLFLLYAQIGRAAENQNQPVPPFYEQIGNQAVNYYWYLAATLAYQDPALLSKITDQDLNGNIAYLLKMLQDGNFPRLKIDLELEGEDFDLAKFSEQYELNLNGMTTEVPDSGQLEIFLGRTDIYLKRTDSGSGLSERLEVSKLEDKIYFVRDTARKKMGADFIDQLFLNPNECTPALDGEILNYLAIYAKMHARADIYIAVPQFGNPNRTYVWRYDRGTANLSLVGGGADGFPVRFAALASVGVMYNGMTPTYDLNPADEAPSIGSDDPIGDILTNNLDANLKLTPAYVPLNLELRGHYNRLMVNAGIELGYNTGGADRDAQWIETIPTPGHEDATVVGPDVDDYDNDGDTEEQVEVYQTPGMNRTLFVGAGALLGRDAGVGFGPRVGLRVGWSNVPHAWTPTLHVGWNVPPPMIKPVGDRIRPFLDVDLRAGVAVPRKDSLAHKDNGGAGLGPVFGATAGVGTTF